MARDVQAEHFALERELVLPVPFVVRHLDGKGCVFCPAVAAQAREEVELALVRGFLGGQHRVHCVLLDEHETLAWVLEGIERPRLNE